MVEQAKHIASEIRLPSSTDWAHMPTALEVAKVRALVYSFRAPGTWKRLLPAWRRAKAYIQSRMAAAGEKLTAAALGSKRGRNYIYRRGGVQCVRVQHGDLGGLELYPGDLAGARGQ